MNADQIKQLYPGYTGWNDRAAIEADFRATGGSGKGGPSSNNGGNSGMGVNTSSPQNTVQSALDLSKGIREQNIQAAQPAIDTLKSGIQPLTDRYTKLIDSIKGQGQTNLQTAGVGAAQEFGKRGIPLSSGAYDTFLQSRQLPVQQATDQSVIGAEGQLQDKTNAITSAIANLQAGAGGNSISEALSLLTGANNIQSSQAQQALASRPQTQVVEANGRKLLIDTQTGRTVQDLGSSNSGGGEGLDISSLMGLLGGGNTQKSSGPTEPKPTNQLGPVSSKSPNGQWAWDYSTKDWYPVGA